MIFQNGVASRLLRNFNFLLQVESEGNRRPTLLHIVSPDLSTTDIVHVCVLPASSICFLIRMHTCQWNVDWLVWFTSSHFCDPKLRFWCDRYKHLWVPKQGVEISGAILIVVTLLLFHCLLVFLLAGQVFHLAETCGRQVIYVKEKRVTH